MNEVMSLVWRRFAGVALAVAATALAARLSVDLPLTPVPQTAQTLAVLASGVLLGSLWGAVAMATYVVAGAVGLPVFASGGSGWETLIGPTGGFLLGFVLAAGLAGWLVESGRTRTLPAAVLGMGLAQAAVLGTGWLWLATSLGSASAFERGVAPFLAGGLLKAVLAGLLAVWVSRRPGRPFAPQSRPGRR